MKKPWSITTTMRNPYRMREFLEVLRTLEGSIWNHATQVEYQTRLIRARFYGYGEPQFYKSLTSEQVDVMNDIDTEMPDEMAADIFRSKNYTDPPMRGRQSYNPLKKFGFVALGSDKRLEITDLGNRFLEENYDLQDVFLRILLKWQIPNPDNRRTYKTNDYDIKPFVGVLHLIRHVNELEESLGREPKGIGKREFSLFAPTLVHHRDIELYAQRIVDLRRELSGLTGQARETRWQAQERSFAEDFLQSKEANQIDSLLKNLKDYGDNAIRYIRLTSYIRIRGGGFHVDLEERRYAEINALLETESGAARSFQDHEAFVEYIADPTQPTLPWDTPDRQAEVIQQLEREIRRHERTLNMSLSEFIEPARLSETERRERIARLEARRRELQAEARYRSAQEVESIQETIDILNGIHSYEQRPILLEKTATLGLCAFNDALGIDPQYPVGDDDEPTFTAPANTPDIECFYGMFNAICEVTMLTGRDQWYHEGQPVMRHLRDFEKRHPDKRAYCLFIAPRMHRDTVNTFWNAVRFEYEGASQRIVPLTIRQFARILGTLLEFRSSESFFPHGRLQQLFDGVLSLTDSVRDSTEWMDAIPEAIRSWEEAVLE